MKNKIYYQHPNKAKQITHIDDITDPLGALMAKYIRKFSGLHPSIPIPVTYINNGIRSK